jgi:hypothetical protein
MSFAYPARASVLVLALAACSPGPKGDTTDTDTTTTTGPGPGTEGMSSTDSPTGTTTEVPVTTATDGIFTTSGTTEVPATTATDGIFTTSGTTLGPGTTTDTTTGGLVCDLVELTTQEAHELGGEVQDCGVVDPWNNTAQEWQAARDCALAAAAAEQQFQLVTWLQGVDSSIGRGYAGVAARSFALEQIHFDSLGSPIAFEQSCDGLVALDGCIVTPGEACLECTVQGLSQPLCDLP